MRVVIQRSKNSSVKYNQHKETIDFGLMILVGFTKGDNSAKIDYVVNKIVNLRIFDDNEGIMNKSVLDVKGSILTVPQFTLYANTEKGRRPSYVDALEPKEATILYNSFNQKLKEKKIDVKTGLFGAEMELKITNEGPVTIIVER